MTGGRSAPADGPAADATTADATLVDATTADGTTARGTERGDAGDPRLPWRAPPLLAAFASAGVLTAADVRVAERLGTLTGEADGRVLLAAALAVRAVRAGSVCLPLAEAHALVDVADPDAGGAAHGPVPDGTEDLPGADLVAALPWPDAVAWEDAVRRSPMVADGPDGPRDRPVRWVDGRVYLDRYWRDEQVVRHVADERLAAVLPADDDAVRTALAARFPEADDARQRLAAATAAVSRLTVLTGGPGTGKTTTVARLVAVLRDLHGADLRIALAAPTGRAAARLQEAVDAQLTALAVAGGGARPPTLRASTLHRLLGPRPGGGTRFRHDRTHRLPHEVVVVDEASMVSLPLLARLLDALRPDARLVLVGDPDQLASVEVGAVLGDLVARVPTADALPARLAALVPAEARDADPAALRGGVVRLTVPHRFGTDLAALADAVRRGRGDDVLALLRAGGPHVSFVETAGAVPDEAELAGVRDDVATSGAAVVRAARAGDAAGALDALGRHRLLLAHRRGLLGVSHWATVAQEWVDAAAGPGDGPRGPWEVGTPLLVAVNDRTTGLANGDTGVVVGDGAGGAVVAFGTPSAPRLVRPHRLPAVEPVHAMTVHRAQGSQYGRVSVLLPPAASPLLTRELLYTAVTRARDAVTVVGTADAVLAAVTRPVRRASGLRFAR
ncbi:MULTISPECIES: exodeoxyribonuclease V subunit alpha [Cellulomonas]|uniref:exodeoxyribonuclease V subunit alpha n=1 Tax=Cellulomonas TaxID=1707 RepID=UPI001FEB6639|nr:MULTISPECIES: exodeoxyribonuclease V subunit alpha [Cellulomonas]